MTEYINHTLRLVNTRYSYDEAEYIIDTVMIISNGDFEGLATEISWDEDAMLSQLYARYPDAPEGLKFEVDTSTTTPQYLTLTM